MKPSGDTSQNKNSDKIFEKEFQGRYAKTVFKTLSMAYARDRVLLACFLVAGFCGRLLILGNSNIIGIWADRLVRGPKPPIGPFGDWSNKDFIIILVVMNILGLLLGLGFRIGFSVVAAKAVSQIYDETTLRVSRFPMKFFDQNPTGRIVTRFSSDYGSVFRLFGGPLAEFLSILFDLLGMIVLITVASPRYLPILIFIGFLNFLTYRLNQAKLRAGRRTLSASRSPSIAHFSETTQGSVTIRSFNRELPFAERFSRLDKNYLQNKIQVVKNLLLYSLQMNSLTSLLLLLTGWMAIGWVQDGVLTMGSVGVAFGFIMLSGNTVQMFFEWLAQFEEALIGLERMDQYLRMPLEESAKLPPEAFFATDHPKRSAPWVRDPKLPASISIDLRNVWLKYGESLPYVLKDIDLKVAAGQKLGIIGATGSGKSSLVQVLLHMYPIEKGSIRLNEKTAEEMGLEEYRSLVGYIPQDPVLFQSTVRENLDPSAELDDHQVLAVLDQVGLKIALNLKVDEKGKNLSLGEKQLLCLARCLLEQRPLIIMDEATSSVDPKSEEIMSAAIKKVLEGRTQLIIAHRLSTLQNCDSILWLKDGLVHRFGDPHQILTEFQDQHPHENLF
jgi:ABC-type multidrug transport system fused ATPase/permease subunit